MTYSPRQQGKARVAGRMLWFTAACVCGWGLASSLAAGQQVQSRFPLSSSQIVSAMQDRQLPTRGVDVRLAAPITAVIAHPQLEIQAIMLLSPHEMRLRVACRDRSECLSFFAIATYPEEIKPGVLTIKPDNKSGYAVPAPAARPVSEVRGGSVAAKPAGAPTIVRGGSPATLDFDGDRVHVRIAVICLESGAAGDKIRVTTRDHKQVYVAEIVKPALLKGTF